MVVLDRHLNGHIFWVLWGRLLVLWLLIASGHLCHGWMIYVFNITAKFSSLVVICVDTVPYFQFLHLNCEKGMV